ncbi:MAG: hypothetical protein KA981_12340, partial [Bacteroidia bacterium]|nr:hypothetical protein [Bacteroidia bacterium]
MKKLLFIPILILFIFKVSGQNSEFNPKTLSKSELSNVMAFAKIYGYVRHFYPSTEVDQMKNWEKLIADNLPRIEQSAHTKELVTNLSRAFLPYAPLLSINGELRNVINSGKHIVYRKNIGWGNRGENATQVTLAVYSSDLISIPFDSVLPPNILPPSQSLSKKINDKITVSWPLSVFANDSFTLPHNYGFTIDTNQYNYKSANRQVRMGCIIEFWNVMQHFYPYMDELKINHDPILEKYLQLASEANSEEQFFSLLEWLGAEYKDGHAAFMPYYYVNWADFVPPIRAETIEGK